MYRSSWCEIDLDAFRVNLRSLRDEAQTRALLVVKANAYGHGLVRMAHEAVRAGIDMLGVATIHEAEQLRENSISTPILMMCAMDNIEIDFCVQRGIDFIAWRLDQFERARLAAMRFGAVPRIHLEIDTGVSRSGVTVKDLPDLVEHLTAAHLSFIRGLMTHFHSADLEDIISSVRQLSSFEDAIDVVTRLGLRPLIHAANSPATLRLPKSRLDMVRLGIAAYGLPPSPYSFLPDSCKPILSWYAKVTNVKSIDAGMGVGYGWRHVASEAQRIGTIGIGYADGFRRSPLGVNSVLLEGVRAPVIGSVFMDQCVFLIPEGSSCDIGSTVTLLGEEGDELISADQLAQLWNTNNYDVVSGIRERVPRKYTNSLHNE